MSKKYYVRKEGFILGSFYKEGDEIVLSDEQVKYLIEPFGDSVSLKNPKRKPIKLPEKNKE